MRLAAGKVVALAGLTLGLWVALPLDLGARERAPIVRRPSIGQSSVDAAKLGAIVDWLKADVEKGRIPGAIVLVAQDGKILLHEAVGWADKDKKIPMRRDSIHPIASSTKLITTVAALRLFEQNKLSVMAPIATYLPELKDLKIEKRDGAATGELIAPAR